MAVDDLFKPFFFWSAHQSLNFKVAEPLSAAVRRAFKLFCWSCNQCLPWTFCAHVWGLHGRWKGCSVQTATGNRKHRKPVKRKNLATQSFKRFDSSGDLVSAVAARFTSGGRVFVRDRRDVEFHDDFIRPTGLSGTQGPFVKEHPCP